MHVRIGFVILLMGCLSLAVSGLAGEGKLLIPSTIERSSFDDDNQTVIYSGFQTGPARRNLLNLRRNNPWSLPKASISAKEDQVITLRLLGLRFDFVKELPNNDSTTGDGTFDFRDTLDFLKQYKHLYDPSPHDKNYFSSHMEALRHYYFFVSGGKIDITWEIFPAGDQEVFHLPQEMAYYGRQRPDSGLGEFFHDCFVIADTADIDFSEYDSYFLFHAGSDRQNDLGFPETPHDLFTGYIFFIDPDTRDTAPGIYVDKTLSDSTAIYDALIMPEMASQDNRAVVLNAVMAHEFGHQLGLVDLYRTDYFLTRVGDFALMDNNGFGTSVEFANYPEVGGVLGSIPVYPMAWSRAFLGFDSVVVYREGTAIEVAASEMASIGTKVAKIPISEYEYFLIENRQEEVDGKFTAVIADPVTSVFLGPGDLDKELSGEYDRLLPGSGMLIWHVDESVALMDYDGDGIDNFLDNHLQNNPYRPFIKLIEADGLVNFGGIYYSGFGTREDMYYAGNNTSFTPNTNPPAVGSGGTNTHIYITDISESDLVMSFDLESDFISDGFPQRAGIPDRGLSPVAADLDGDDSTEIIIASRKNLTVLNEDGTDFTPTFAPYIYDTVYAPYHEDSGYFHSYPLKALFAQTPYAITAGPAIGDFGGLHEDTQFVAVGVGPYLYVYDINYDDLGMAEQLFGPLTLDIYIRWLSFDDRIYAAGMDFDLTFVKLYEVSYDNIAPVLNPASPTIEESELYGVVNFQGTFAVLAGDTSDVYLYYVPDPDTAYGPYDLGGYYIYGPVGVDLDRDDRPEVIVATPDGNIRAVTIDRTQADPFVPFESVYLDDSIFVNPVVSDIDNDGYPDVILGGKNKIMALNRVFSPVSNFPVMIDRLFPEAVVIAAPVVADINGDGVKDVIASTSAGSCYAFSSKYALNDQLLHGFPIAAGGLLVSAPEPGSPLLFRKRNGGGLGFLGIDGWFYSYDVGYDSSSADWPMAGGGPHSTFHFPSERLGAVKIYAEKLVEEKFYCFPNPTLDGQTNLHYLLGEGANLTFTFYDMAGQKVTREIRKYNVEGGIEDIQPWDGSSLPTGVYRCILEAEFDNGEKLSTFTDIAIIK